MREIYDLHVHTRYSIDADKSEENSLLCKARYAKGCGHPGLAFTDHFDANLVFESIEPHDSENIRRDIRLARDELCDGTFKIINGIEFGAQRYFEDFCGAEILRYGYDMVISSVHIPGADNKNLLSKAELDKWSDKEITDVFELYLDDLVYTARYCDFDILAHITYPMRYFRRFGRDGLVQIEKYSDVFDEIFKSLIFRGKALEVNTSGLRQGHGETYPNVYLLRRYIELGGKLFTLGSDSHCPYDMFSDFEESADMLKSLGAEYLCLFESRNMSFLKL